MTESRFQFSTVGPQSETGVVVELFTAEEDDRPITLVGNLNNWMVDPLRYGMARVGHGHYQITLPHLSFPLEYKFVKGGWEGEEVDAYGSVMPNRKLVQFQPRITDFVPRWKKNGVSYLAPLLPRIEILSERFEIPQLIKTRRISVLLPHNYHQTDKRYPVLYLQDGQNLFDDHAPFGNWAVDKRLAVMSERGSGDIIIVAIDHAAEERLAEFTPTYQTRLGSGDGKKYVRFLADTLKPYIDQRFRTLPDRLHTGIGGSSMGGLISIYAGLMYPEVYGKLLIFSPSLWVAPNIQFQAIRFDDPAPTRIYLYAGGKESRTMVPSIQRFKEALEKQGHTPRIEFRMSIDPQGEHNEEHWGREFPKAVEWLFGQNA